MNCRLGDQTTIIWALWIIKVHLLCIKTKLLQEANFWIGKEKWNKMIATMSINTNLFNKEDYIVLSITIILLWLVLLLVMELDPKTTLIFKLKINLFKRLIRTVKSKAILSLLLLLQGLQTLQKNKVKTQVLTTPIY